jgi:hypothetical protein
MNNLRPERRRSALTFCGGLLLTFPFIAPLQSAPTNPKPWTTIGSAGTVQLGTFSYQNSSAFLDNSSDGGIIRYNVVAVDGLRDTNGPGPSPAHIRLRARFRDADAASRVRINLRRTRISDGFTANVAGVALDSNNYPAAIGFQTRNTVCASTEIFDFLNYVYYVEVQMTRGPGAGVVAPAISAIQVGWDDGPCLTGDTTAPAQ